MTKPDKGNVKIVANVLNPSGVPHESSYTAGNATAEERDEKMALYNGVVRKRNSELAAIARSHLGEAELTQEVNE
jgi:hypothetical protein